MYIDSVCSPVFLSLVEGGSESLQDGRVLVADWLDICLDQPFSCRS